VIHIDEDDDDGDKKNGERGGGAKPTSLGYTKNKAGHNEDERNLMTGRTMNKSLYYSYDTDNSVVDRPNVICGGCRPKTQKSSSLASQVSHAPAPTRSLLERQQTYSTTSNSTSPSTTRPASHSFAGRLPVTAATAKGLATTAHSAYSSSNIELSLDTPFFRADEKDDNSIKKECVEVNVIVKTNSFSGTNVSPSVILELPVITTTTVDDDGDEAKSREDSVSTIPAYRDRRIASGRRKRYSKTKT
jgi:hypothetical protein